MRRWSEVAERVGATPRTSEKTSLLADALRAYPAAELPVAAVFFTGRPFAGADDRTTGLGWSAIATTVARVTGASTGALGEAYDRSSDLGIAVADLMARRPAQPDPALSPTVTEVARAYAEVQAASGPARKGAILEALLLRSDPLAENYSVKIHTGEIRIGLREGLLEAAVGRAFERPLDAVKRAGMLVGDVGAMALLAAEDRLAEARPILFHPLKFMLASPAED